MSALSDKISSYAIDGYATLNYAVSGSPLVIPQTATTLFSNNPSTSNDVYEPTVTPTGGGGSWKISVGATGTGWSNSWQGLNFNNAQNDGDYSMGMWIRFNSLPAGTLSINHFGHFATPSNTNSGFQFQLAGTLHATIPGRWRLLANGVTQDLSFGPTVGQWHYLAVTKKTNGTIKFYIDNVLVRTTTGLSTSTALSTFSVGPTNNSGAAYSFNMCDYYVAPTSAIDEAQIAQIWAIGSTGIAPRTVKYFNGTSWVDSVGQKVWNGTAWIDWNAKRFNGTNWVVV